MAKKSAQGRPGSEGPKGGKREAGRPGEIGGPPELVPWVVVVTPDLIRRLVPLLKEMSSDVDRLARRCELWGAPSTPRHTHKVAAAVHELYVTLRIPTSVDPISARLLPFWKGEGSTTAGGANPLLYGMFEDLFDVARDLVRRGYLHPLPPLGEGSLITGMLALRLRDVLSRAKAVVASIEENDDNRGDRLTPCEEDILQTLKEEGRRLGRKAVIESMKSKGRVHGESTIRNALSRLARRGRVTSGSGRGSEGYGLPEWDLPGPGREMV
jgi:hypothetical protein